MDNMFTQRMRYSVAVSLAFWAALTSLLAAPTTPVGASGAFYTQTRDAAVYTYVPYISRAFAHNFPGDYECGTYAIIAGAQFPSLVNQDYSGIPNYWVYSGETVTLTIIGITGTMRVGTLVINSPTGYYVDSSNNWVTVAGGYETGVYYYLNHVVEVPVNPSFNSYYAISSYSGPAITYSAGRTDYMRPYRAYGGDPFYDISNSSPEAYPTSRLYSAGITTGVSPGEYAPNANVPRYQMATFIARAMGWQNEEWWDYTFSDIGWLPYEHQRHIRALAHYGVARGYEPATCAAFGRAHPCYVPEDNIAYVQTLAFVSRANVAKGHWTWQPNFPAVYPNVPAGHRQDVSTYVSYSGRAPDAYPFANWAWYANATTRGWYGRALWQALP